MRLTHVHMNKFEEYSPYIDTLVLPMGRLKHHGPHRRLAPMC